MKALNRQLAGALALSLIACSPKAPIFELPNEASARTFQIRIPTDFVARQGEVINQSKDSLQITNRDRLPVDKQIEPGQFSGKMTIGIRLLGKFEGKFPVPAGATGEGRALAGPEQLEARSWIHPSPSPHEVGLMYTFLIAGKGRLYQLNTWAPTDQRETDKRTALLDQMVLSMKFK